MWNSVNTPSARDLLLLAVSDVIGNAVLPLECVPVSSVEGSFVQLNSLETGKPVALLDAVPPHQSEFDKTARDNLRKVAARLSIPLIAVTNLRSMVVYDVVAASAMAGEEQQVVYCSDIRTNIGSLADADLPANQIQLLMLLKGALQVCSVPNTPASNKDDKAAAYVTQRLDKVAQDIIWCCSKNSSQESNVTQLILQCLTYGILQEKSPTLLPVMQLPCNSRHVMLCTSILNAYFSEIHRSMPDAGRMKSINLEIVEEYETHCVSAISSVVELIVQFKFKRLTNIQLNTLITRVQNQFISKTGAGILAENHQHLLVAALKEAAGVDLPSRTVSVLEVGGASGGFSEFLASHFSDTSIVCTHRGAHNAVPAIAQLGILRSVEKTSFSIYENVAVTKRPVASASRTASERETASELGTRTVFDVAFLNVTAYCDRHILRHFLSNANFSDHAVGALVAPTALLYHADYASIRKILQRDFEIVWVFTSNMEPLCNPDTDACSIVFRRRKHPDHQPVFVYLRTPLFELMKYAEVTAGILGAQQKVATNLLHYLRSGKRGKVNSETVVTKIPSHYLSRTTWDEFAIPYNVLWNIVQKLMRATQPLAHRAQITSGMRTGANEVFVPSLEEIENENLEERFWKSEKVDGSLVDNVLVTSTSELRVIQGPIPTNKRLLLLPPTRAELQDTNVLKRIEQAEQQNLHQRSTVRGRKPWWTLQVGRTPTLIVPRSIHDRWIVSLNTYGAHVSDVGFAIYIHCKELHIPIALYLNSTVGLFALKLLRSDEFESEVTVRDLGELRIPRDNFHVDFNTKKVREFLHREIGTREQEYGSKVRSSVRESTIALDRLHVDRIFIDNLLSLTPEETHWLYRFAMEWYFSTSNLHHLAKALSYALQANHKLKPLYAWYTPFVQQLPVTARTSRKFTADMTSAEHRTSMFGHQVAFFENQEMKSVLDCQSSEEAEIITLLFNLGVRAVEYPSDKPLIAQILPDLRTFTQSLKRGFAELTSNLPNDIHASLNRLVQENLARV